MATPFGVGDKTGESEKGEVPQYEHGRADVQDSLLTYAIGRYPKVAPMEALGRVFVDEATDEGHEWDGDD